MIHMQNTLIVDSVPTADGRAFFHAIVIQVVGFGPVEMCVDTWELGRDGKRTKGQTGTYHPPMREGGPAAVEAAWVAHAWWLDLWRTP